MQAYVQTDYMQRNPSAKITDGVTGIQSFSITVTVVDKFFLKSGVYIEETAFYQVPEKHQSGGKQNMTK
jgi:hypothetical protein